MLVDRNHWLCEVNRRNGLPIGSQASRRLSSWCLVLLLIGLFSAAVLLRL